MSPLPAAAHPGDVHPLLILPFVALLLMIATGPLLFEKWWQRNFQKVAIGLALIPICYYAFVLKHAERLLIVAHEYISFIALIGSLFVVAGGIHLTITWRTKPSLNVLFLFVGAVIANIIGTTGASMLLVRPWVRLNRSRIAPFHIVFFIFIVSNVGGALTPLGDPPLFLGYLKGVPFLWGLVHCWAGWAIALGLLLAVFFIHDTRHFLRTPERNTPAPSAAGSPRFEGRLNLLFLAAIIAAVLANRHLPRFAPDAIMFAMAAASYFTTRKSVHTANDFTFAPIIEVAWLFAGIFATMVPALDYLERHSVELGLRTPLQFYWATGSLSSFLDNAPTYLTFLAAALGNQGLGINNPTDISAFIAGSNTFLVAISLGAVFFGAMTYIGNGPNFLVKNIAQQLGVETPGFFGYILRYALPVLLPILALVGLLFFSRWRLF